MFTFLRRRKDRENALAKLTNLTIWQRNFANFVNIAMQNLHEILETVETLETVCSCEKATLYTDIQVKNRKRLKSLNCLMSFFYWYETVTQESQLSHAFFTQSKMGTGVDNDYRKMSSLLVKIIKKLSTLFKKSQNIMLATQFLGGRRATSCRRLYDAQRKHSNVRDGDNLLCRGNLCDYTDRG